MNVLLQFRHHLLKREREC